MGSKPFHINFILYSYYMFKTWFFAPHEKRIDYEENFFQAVRRIIFFSFLIINEILQIFW